MNHQYWTSYYFNCFVHLLLKTRVTKFTFYISLYWTCTFSSSPCESTLFIKSTSFILGQQENNIEITLEVTRRKKYGRPIVVQTSNCKMQNRDMSKLYTNLSIQIMDGISFWMESLSGRICFCHLRREFSLLI